MGKLIYKGAHDRNGQSPSKQSMAVVRKYTVLYSLVFN